MLTSVAQRWRGGRAVYRPAGTVINPRRYEVAPIAGDAEAREFVTRHHYSGSYPAARERVGLYRGGALVGVAVFSVPVQGKVLDALPCPRAFAVELGRLVLLDDVEANGESWFIARAFDHLRRRGFAGVISFADPEPRRAADGRLIFPGHIGGIYQATNAIYAGRSTPRTLRLLPSGTVVSARTLQKIRARDRGWRYGVDQLVAAGAAPPAGSDLRAWLAAELPRITRTMQHRGCHRYLFGLHPAVRRKLTGQPHLPYPKLEIPRL